MNSIRMRDLVALCSVFATTICLAAITATPAEAGVKVYEKDDKYVEVGGRVQLQYMREDPETGEATDSVFFRRLRPYVQGSVTKNWDGKIQFDIGKASGDNEIAIKDAFMRYKGKKNKTLSIGNTKTPFSREFLTSSKRQQLVERTFTGDHNYGVPDRQLGFRLDGHNDSKKVSYAVAVGAENHDPTATKIDFDTPVNNSSDWNEGVVIGGRIDVHPKGFMKFDQGDFHTDSTKYTLGLGAFTWSNDDDNNTYTDPGTGLSTSTSRADLDSANGFEFAGGIRGKGFSADLAYQMVSGDTVDTTFTGGVFRAGTTDLDKLSLEGGYMLKGNNLEIVAAYQSQGADNYVDDWDRTTFGLNYFWNKHKAKVQFSYEIGSNIGGVQGADQDTSFVQFQYVF